MRSLRELAGAARRAVELAVAEAVDLAVGRRGGSFSSGTDADRSSTGGENFSHGGWDGARTALENVFRYRAGLGSHFAACVVFNVDGRDLKTDLIVSRHLFKNKPPREASEQFQKTLMSLLDDFVARHGGRP